MDDSKNLRERFYRLRSPIQLILGLNLLVLVVGIVTFFIVVAINPGVLESIGTLLITIGNVVAFLNTVVTTIVLLLSNENGASK